jgi:hypothetical protein
MIWSRFTLINFQEVFMKKIALFCFASLFSGASLAISSYTGTNTNGVVVIEDVEVNGQPVFDSVSMDLDLKAGTFTIVDIKTKNKTVFTSPIETFSDDGFNIGLLGCSRSAGTNEISCYLQIVNTLLDRTITINGDTAITPSLVTDNLGNVYRPASITNNNVTKDFVFPILLAQGIPTRVVIRYKGIDVNAKSLSSFMPGFSGSKLFNVAFKNINF